MIKRDKSIYFDERQLIDILLDHIYQVYGVTFDNESFRFDYTQGYNGEMGGKPYRTKINLIWFEDETISR